MRGRGPAEIIAQAAEFHAELDVVRSRIFAHYEATVASAVAERLPRCDNKEASRTCQAKSGADPGSGFHFILRGAPVCAEIWSNAHILGDRREACVPTCPIANPAHRQSGCHDQGKRCENRGEGYAHLLDLSAADLRLL
jgi:hypothetical protein